MGHCIQSFIKSMKPGIASSIVFGFLILVWVAMPVLAAQNVAPICPAGYSYNSGTKMCETTTSKVCPTDTVPVGGSCGKKSVPTCPNGYHKIPPQAASNWMGCKLDDKLKLTSLPRFAQSSCPKDYNKQSVKVNPITYEETCWYRVFTYMVCPTAFTQRWPGPICVSQKIPSCPQGYRFNAQFGRCTIIQTGTPQ